MAASLQHRVTRSIFHLLFVDNCLAIWRRLAVTAFICDVVLRRRFLPRSSTLVPEEDLNILTVGGVTNLPHKVPPLPHQGLITGGQEDWKKFPYVTALYYNDQYICTSSIIGPTTILTAAHCVVFDNVLQPAEFFHAVANINRTAPEIIIEFSEIFVHPDYMMKNLNADVAVMKTKSPIPMDGKIPIKPVCIAGPIYAFKLMIDKRAIAVGWGKTSNNDTTFPEILHYADQVIVENIFCGFVNEAISKVKLCAKGVFKIAGICSGDSGGPLVTKDDPPVQVGIASYINSDRPCGVGPGVFARVTVFAEFIKGKAKEPICVI